MARKVIKSKGGKILEVLLEVRGTRIERVVISGDFMAFPPYSIDELERALVGKGAEDVTEVVSRILRGVELVGVSEEEIADVIRELASSH